MEGVENCAFAPHCPRLSDGPGQPSAVPRADGAPSNCLWPQWADGVCGKHQGLGGNPDLRAHIHLLTDLIIFGRLVL